MKFKEHDRVVLTADVESDGLRIGDVGTVVHLYTDGEGCEVEFVTLDGQDSVVVTVNLSQVRPVKEREITHARVLTHP